MYYEEQCPLYLGMCTGEERVGVSDEREKMEWSLNQIYLPLLKKRYIRFVFFSVFEVIASLVFQLPQLKIC